MTLAFGTTVYFRTDRMSRDRVTELQGVETGYIVEVRRTRALVQVGARQLWFDIDQLATEIQTSLFDQAGQ